MRMEFWRGHSGFYQRQPTKGLHALSSLAHMYAQGLGTRQNVAEAIRLFEAVGKPENSTDAFEARIELGRICSRGVGVPVNKKLALKWYTAAIELATENDDSEELQEARAYIRQTAP